MQSIAGGTTAHTAPTSTTRSTTSTVAGLLAMRWYLSA